MQNANAKARQLAEAAGATLGELVLLTEGAPPPVPRQIGLARDDAMGAGAGGAGSAGNPR